MKLFPPSLVRPWLVGFGVSVVAMALPFASTATADSPNRYPYDPACAWGRLSDGHGMLIRCLEPSEATTLLEAGVPGGTPEQPKESKATKDQRATSESSPQSLAVTSVGPATADTGELPLAAKKLGIPKDRYIKCVRDHGGLTGNQGKVVVRFLVRERGRAEGVSVKSSSGMSKEAAACIAEVVDRRYVGYPAAPIVGATIPIELSVQP